MLQIKMWKLDYLDTAHIT